MQDAVAGMEFRKVEGEKIPLRNHSQDEEDQRTLGGVQYSNTGDWVENCTALVEDHSGELRLLAIQDWLRDEAPRAARLRAA